MGQSSEKVHRPPTFILDVDGCILEHLNQGSKEQWDPENARLTSNAIDQLNEMHSVGGHIVLMTARPESLRYELEESLRNLGVFWDQLVMGVNNGSRVVINDGECLAIRVQRNELSDCVGEWGRYKVKQQADVMRTRTSTG